MLYFAIAFDFVEVLREFPINTCNIGFCIPGAIDSEYNGIPGTEWENVKFTIFDSQLTNSEEFVENVDIE